MTEFAGLFVATLTPFDDFGRVDMGVVRDHTDFLLSSGAAGVCPAGTTGEFLYLTTYEKIRVIEETVARASRRGPVIAGSWALSPVEMDVLGRAARDAGADAVFLPPPIYYAASDDAICQHYAAAAASSGLPVFAYNIPGCAVNSVSVEALERMASDGTVAGIKDSSANADRMKTLVEKFGTRLRVMAASDSFATQGRKLGAHGFISALANVFPASFARLWAGDESLQPAVDTLRKAVKANGGIPAIKRLATLRGFPFGLSRLPYANLTEEAIRVMDAAYDRAKESGLE